MNGTEAGQRQSGLPGFRLYKPGPSHPDWKELFEETRHELSEIRKNVKKDTDTSFSEKLLDLSRKRKAYITTISGFLENRRRLKAGDKSLRAIYWIWAMLNGCNLRCTYCDDHSGQGWFEKNDSDTLDTEQGKKLLEVMRTGCSAIYFCGGEPTLRNDLPELVDHAFDLGYYPMAMNSNITIIHKRLKDPAWKDLMRKLDILVISVDSLSPEKLDSIFQRPLGKQVLVNALMLRELKKTNRFLLIANSVVTPETVTDARQVLDWCNDLGIFFAAVPANYKEGPNPDLVNMPEYCSFVDTVLSRKRQGHKIIGSMELLDKFLNAKPYTCMTTIKPHIGPHGSLPWPCRASINVEPEFLNVLDYETVDEMYEAGDRIIKATDFHGPARNQCGGWCAWYQNYTTEIYRNALLKPWRFMSETRELTSNL